MLFPSSSVATYVNSITLTGGRATIAAVYSAETSNVPPGVCIVICLLRFVDSWLIGSSITRIYNRCLRLLYLTRRILLYKPESYKSIYTLLLTWHDERNDPQRAKVLLMGRSRARLCARIMYLRAIGTWNKVPSIIGNNDKRRDTKGNLRNWTMNMILF